MGLCLLIAYSELNRKIQQDEALNDFVLLLHRTKLDSKLSKAAFVTGMCFLKHISLERATEKNDVYTR